MTLWSPESASTPALTLRPYQDRAVDAVVTAWASDPRVCLALPTGAGKTVVAAGLIRTAQAEGMRVAFVTDRLTLIPQTIRMFESAGLRCAVVQGDNTSGPGEQSAAHVVICSAQTLDARHIDPNDLDVVMTIVDECHVERAVVARWLDMGVCMCGLTATPLARWMPEKWKQLISPVTTREAIDDDWLLEPTFRAEIVDIEKDVSEYIGSPVGPGGDWSDDQAAQIMEPHLDAVVTAWKRVVALPSVEGGFDGQAPQTIVQAATVDHAEALAMRFNSALPSAWGTVNYRQSQDESASFVDSFRAGNLRGLVSVAKLMVGFDAPEAACFVSARPTRRLLPWVQSIGRIMRTGSPTATVVDCTGNAARFAARLHRFWAAGAVWPLPESPDASPSPPTSEPQPAARYPCPDHPEIVHPPNAQVCKVCFRPLQEVEPPDTAKVWKDGVTASELGRSVRMLASQRIAKYAEGKNIPPGYPSEAAGVWARVQIMTLTGQWPRRDWPGEISPSDPFTVERPHPVVAKLIKLNTKAWIVWKETPEDTREPEPPVETINLKGIPNDR